LPITLPSLPADMSDPRDPADSADPNDPADPMEKADPADPTDPMDPAEPTEPIERMLPFDAMDRMESSDHSDHFELPIPLLLSVEADLLGARAEAAALRHIIPYQISPEIRGPGVGWPAVYTRSRVVTRSRGGPRPAGRRAALLVVAALLLGSCGSSGASPSAPSVNSSRLRSAKAAFCQHLVDIGAGAIDRIPAIQRLVAKLRRDVDAFRQAGDAKDSAAVRKLVQAYHGLVAALHDQSGVTKATGAVERALSGLPECR